jgi:hypothetical protein
MVRSLFLLIFPQQEAIHRIKIINIKHCLGGRWEMRGGFWLLVEG